MAMATIGLALLILVLITPTPSFSIAQIPTRPSTTALVGSASQRIAKHTDFTRSGYYRPTNGAFKAVGTDQNGWLSTASVDIYNSFINTFTAKTDYPSSRDARWVGFTLRCLNQ